MIQQKQLAGGLLAVSISIALQANVSAATDTPSTSWLMSEAEVAAHTAAMAELEGAARDEYRNAQYEQLKRRAETQGFTLPATPPWSKQASNPSAAASSEDAAAARHAEMREKLKARREAMQKASEANLERLQEAANAQHKQVQADQQRLGEEASRPQAVTEVSPVAAPAAEIVAAPPTVTSDPAMPPTPVAITEPPTGTPPAPIKAPVAVQAPEPPAPPAPPSPPTRAATNVAPVPRFAPVQQTAAPMPEPAPAQAMPVEVKEPPPEVAAATDQPADAMTAYRENMRTRFDEYMQERQVQMEENARRQREQHEAAMEQNRALRANRAPYAPYPYPAAPPSYGPRYPAAYPGYRTPPWQQQ